jgi:hypothetical protein
MQLLDAISFDFSGLECRRGRAENCVGAKCKIFHGARREEKIQSGQCGERKAINSELSPSILLCVESLITVITTFRIYSRPV